MAETWRRMPIRRFDEYRAFGFDDSEALLAFLFEHGPHTTALPGVSRVGRRGVAESLDWSDDKFDRCFRTLETRGLVVADWKSRIVLLRAALRDGVPDSPSAVGSAWRRAFDDLPAGDLKGEIDAGVRAILARHHPKFLQAWNGTLGPAEPPTKPPRSPRRTTATRDRGTHDQTSVQPIRVPAGEAVGEPPVQAGGEPPHEAPPEAGIEPLLGLGGLGSVQTAVQNYHHHARASRADHVLADPRLSPSPETRTGRRLQMRTPAPSALFERFWAAWPNKVAKFEALQAWGELQLEAQPDADAWLHETLVPAIHAQSRAFGWGEADGQFMPNPATWLRNRRWNDEPAERRAPGLTRQPTRLARAGGTGPPNATKSAAYARLNTRAEHGAETAATGDDLALTADGASASREETTT